MVFFMLCRLGNLVEAVYNSICCIVSLCRKAGPPAFVFTLNHIDRETMFIIYIKSLRLNVACLQIQRQLWGRILGRHCDRQWAYTNAYSLQGKTGKHLEGGGGVKLVIPRPRRKFMLWMHKPVCKLNQSKKVIKQICISFIELTEGLNFKLCSTLFRPIQSCQFNTVQFCYTPSILFTLDMSCYTLFSPVKSC